MQANPCYQQCIVFLMHTGRPTRFILFHFSNCVSSSTYYRIEEIQHIQNSREKEANGFPSFLPIVFSSSFFFFFLSPNTYLPIWKIKKCFHWIKVSPVLKELARIQPEPISFKLHFNIGSAVLPFHSLISATPPTRIPIAIYLCPQACASPLLLYVCT